jgi:hypothetical protein
VRDYFKRVHKKTIRLVIHHQGIFRNYRVSIAKAQRVLKFKPQGTIQSILADLDEHIKQPLDLESDRYYNIRVFKKLFHET